MLSYRSNVLNLFSDDGSKNFRITPLMDRVDIAYDGYSIHVSELYVGDGMDDVKVYDKLFQNTALVSGEQSRAEGVESQIDSDLKASVLVLQDIDDGLQIAIDNEVTRATQVDTNFSNSLASETSLRVAGDFGLATDLTFEVNRATAAETVINSNFSAEQTARQTEESRIESKHDVYVSSNNSRLDATELKHDDHETAQGQRSSAIEQSVQVQSDKQAQDLLDTVAARDAAIANLQSQISNVISNTDPASLDSLAEIVSNFNADGANYAQRLHAIESTLNDLLNSGL